jgi:hypothetical protein
MNFLRREYLCNCQTESEQLFRGLKAQFDALRSPNNDAGEALIYRAFLSGQAMRRSDRGALV